VRCGGGGEQGKVTVAFVGYDVEVDMGSVGHHHARTRAVLISGDITLIHLVIMGLGQGVGGGSDEVIAIGLEFIELGAVNECKQEQILHDSVNNQSMHAHKEEVYGAIYVLEYKRYPRSSVCYHGPL